MIGSLPSWECGLKLSHHKRLAVLSYVTPFVGVWIEITVVQISCIATNASLPSWECGLKSSEADPYYAEAGHSLRGSVD